MNVTNFFHLKETALALLLVPFAVLSAFQAKQNLQGIQQFLPLIFLTLFPFAYTILPNFPQSTALMHREQARLAVLILYAIFAFDLMRQPRYRHHITNAFLATATIVALLAFIQRSERAQWLFPLFQESIDPLYSVFGNSGLLGGYIAMAIPIAIYRALTSPRLITPLLMIATMAPILALTSSRASWLGAAIGTLIILPYRTLPAKRILITTAVIATSIASTFISFQETRPGQWLAQEKKDTIRLRLWFWDGAIRMTAANPITGVGPGNFQYWTPKYQGDALKANPAHISNESHTQYAHNEPLHLAAETGLIGILLCGWMLFRLRSCKGPEWGGLTAATIFALFHFPLHSAPHALMILMFATMLLARKTNPEFEDVTDNEPVTRKSHEPSLRGESPASREADAVANDVAISSHGINDPKESPLLQHSQASVRGDEANVKGRSNPISANIEPKRSPLPGERVRVRGQFSNGIDSVPNQTKWIQTVAATTTTLFLAAFTTYDTLLPSIALRHANTLHNQNQPTNQAYEKAINTGRYHSPAHANYANDLLQQGNLTEARNQLEQALKSQDTADLHLALGYIHLQQGNTQKAQKHLTAATHRWPKNQTAHEYLQQVTQ